MAEYVIMGFYSEEAASKALTKLDDAGLLLRKGMYMSARTFDWKRAIQIIREDAQELVRERERQQAIATES